MSGHALLNSVDGLYGQFVHVSAALANCLDQAAISALGYDAIAPAWLRYRVQGTPDLTTYVEAGRLSRASISASLNLIGRRLGEFPRILDFGCGCGRTLRWMRDLTREATVWGVDIDAEAIDWCRGHIGPARFEVTNPVPPLPFPDNSFDLIYALSVFTHLDYPGQIAWLTELRRVLAPGGIVLLTFLGYTPEKYAARPHGAPLRLFNERIMASASLDIWSFLEPAEVEQLDRDGFVFLPYRDSPRDAPYGVAYHRPEHVHDAFGKILPLVSYVPDGFCDYLDAALFQKPG